MLGGSRKARPIARREQCGLRSSGHHAQTGTTRAKMGWGEEELKELGQRCRDVITAVEFSRPVSLHHLWSSPKMAASREQQRLAER